MIDKESCVVSLTHSAIVVLKTSTLPEFGVKFFKELLEVEFPMDRKSIYRSSAIVEINLEWHSAVKGADLML